jgi:peptide/nickel transport system permease protein
MRKFIIRRFFLALLTLLAATVVVFTVSRLAGDPKLIYALPEGYGMSQERLDALDEKLGLNKPLIVQYLLWIGRAMTGDLGNTLFTDRPVMDVILERVPATIQLAIVAWIFGTVVGVPFGIISAVRRGSIFDYIARTFALVGQAAPPFWIGLMAIFLFAVTLGWLPSATKGPPDASLWLQAKHFVLPSVILGWGAAAGYLRLTRSAMLDVLESEYVVLARAKGVSERTVIWKHALGNALISPITYSSLVMAGFLNGAVIAESVFAWPGIGRLATQAVFENDFPTMTGTVLTFAALFAASSFISDILYVVVDPRIRYT